MPAEYTRLSNVFDPVIVPSASGELYAMGLNGNGAAVLFGQVEHPSTFVKITEGAAKTTFSSPNLIPLFYENAPHNPSFPLSFAFSVHASAGNYLGILKVDMDSQNSSVEVEQQHFLPDLVPGVRATIRFDEGGRVHPRRIPFTANTLGEHPQAGWFGLGSALEPLYNVTAMGYIPGGAATTYLNDFAQLVVGAPYAHSDSYPPKQGVYQHSVQVICDEQRPPENKCVDGYFWIEVRDYPTPTGQYTVRAEVLENRRQNPFFMPNYTLVFTSISPAIEKWWAHQYFYPISTDPESGELVLLKREVAEEGASFNSMRVEQPGLIFPNDPSVNDEVIAWTVPTKDSGTVTTTYNPVLKEAGVRSVSYGGNQGKVFDELYGKKVRSFRANAVGDSAYVVVEKEAGVVEVLRVAEKGVPDLCRGDHVESRDGVLMEAPRKIWMPFSQNEGQKLEDARKLQVSEATGITAENTCSTGAALRKAGFFPDESAKPQAETTSSIPKSFQDVRF